MKVEKRDGRLVDFDRQKIRAAILKAFIDVDGGDDSGYAKGKANEIANCISKMGKDVISVEEIQDAVEEKLMASNRKDVARAYIQYRHLHDLARNQYRDLMDAVEEKLSASNVVNQNANVDEKSFGGRRGEASSLVDKKFALERCMSKMARDNHLNNEIYIHDLDSYAVGMHNCFERSTRFITDEGVKSFKDFQDGSKVQVLTKDGDWADATIHMYGRQPMQEVVLERAGKSVTIVCTSNHRWILSNGEVTENISIGDHLYPLQEMKRPSVETKRDAEMFSMGFVIGDGYDHSDRLEVKFCSQEKEQCKKIFALAGYLEGQSNGFPYAFKRVGYSKQAFLTNKCWRLLSKRDKQFLFMGYLSADGTRTTNTQRVSTSDIRVKELIEEIAPLCGYHIFSIYENDRPTNYSEERLLYELTLTKRFQSSSTWVVKNIVKGKHRNKDYEAWCVDEPTTHTFTLEDGIVTGNCLTCPLDDLLANGFNTRQTDVRPAQSVNTAFQLVAVIFQIQSLQQFGGVSAGHLDHTMVPYVRKSFFKHFRDGRKYFDDAVVSMAPEKVVETSIDSDEYKQYAKAYKYALDMTKREIYQAVEGMYHNLKKFGRPGSNAWNIAV